MGIRRNFITGLWEEFTETGGGIIRRITPPGGQVNATGDRYHGGMPNEALGFNAEDIQQVLEIDRQHGVQTDYQRDEVGYQPIIRNRAHFKKYLRAHGMYERNSYDGGPLHYNGQKHKRRDR